MTNVRRKQAIVGIVGLAVLGGGAYVLTDRLAGDEPQVVGEIGGIAPVESSASADAPEPTGSSAAPATTPPKKATTAGATGKPSSAPPTKTQKQQIDEVKGSAAKAAQEVQRPATSAKVNEADVTVKQVPVPAGSLQVISAAQDLTGKRELAWVQGQKGDRVGEASCTQKISLVAGQTPRARETLLICWRVSAAKSVYTIATVPKGKPSAALSVTELGKVWSSL